MDRESQKRKTADAAAFLLIILIATSGIYLFEHLKSEDEKDALEDEHDQRMVAHTSTTLLGTTIASFEYTDPQGVSKTYLGQTVQGLIAQELAFMLSSDFPVDQTSLDTLEDIIADIMGSLAPEDIVMELHAGIGDEEYINIRGGNTDDSSEMIGKWSEEMLIPNNSRSGYITIEFYSTS